MLLKSACIECPFKSSAARTLNNEELSELGGNCAQANFKKGNTIFKQGIFSSNIVYLKEGIVQLHMEGPTTDQIIKISKGPTYLGIPTTLDEKYNRYSGTALTEVNACFINIDTFKQFILENGQFAYEIIIDLCKNEVTLFNKCVNRVQKNIRGRVADAILFFANDIFENDSFIIPLTRSELGNFVASTRETISRILTELNGEEIIELKGKSINIKDKKRLEMISRAG